MLGVTNGEKTFDKGDYLNQSSDVQAVVTLYGLSNLLNIGAGFPENIQDVHRSPASTEALLVIANRLKNDYILCPDMRQRSIAGCYQNNVAWLYPASMMTC